MWRLEPVTEAARLDILHRAVNPRATSREVPVGELVSDFTLFDQDANTNPPHPV